MRLRGLFLFPLDCFVMRFAKTIILGMLLARRWNARNALQLLVAGVRCAIRRNSLRVAREDGLEGRVAGFWCAIVLEVWIEAPGFILCGDWASSIPFFRGIGPTAFPAGIGPTAFPCGDLASLHSAFPTPLPRGPWHNNRKKLKRAPARPSWFFASFPRLQKQAFDARSGYKKSPQALLESFFPLLR